MKSGLLLDVVIAQGTTILKLLSSKDQALLIRRNAFLVLNFGLHIVNGIGGFDIQSDGLSSQGLHEDLHTSTKAEDEVKSGLLLDVVITQSAAILELLSSKDQALLIRWNALLVLDLGLHIVDGVRGFNIQSNSLTSQSLHKDLHTTTKTEHKVKSRLLLDVVVAQGATILELLSGENETLLIRRNALFVLDLSLHVLNGIRWLYIKSNGLSCESLDENLHATAKTKDKMKSGLLLNVVVAQGASILQLLSGKDETLLIWRNALFVLDLSLYVFNSVGRFNVQSDGFTGESFHEDLHT